MPANVDRSARHAVPSWWVVVHVLLSTLAWSPEARAQQATGGAVELDWQAPPNCPQREDFEAAVADRLSAPDAGRGTRATGRIECASGGDCQLTLGFSGTVQGERSLHAPGCEGMDETAAVLVAMALDTTGVSLGAPNEPEPEEVATPESEAERAVESPEAQRTAGPWELELEPRMLIDKGSLPAAQPGGGLSVRTGRGLWKLGVEAAAFRASTRRLDDAGASLRFTAWDLALLAAVEWRLGRVELGPSAGVGATGLAGRSRRVAMPERQSRFMFAPRAGAGLGVALGYGVSLRL